MDMNDELWHRVKDTPRVTGFVGGGTTPVPLSADEINKMLYRQTTSAERPRPKMNFEKNETVRIIDGPFANSRVRWMRLIRSATRCACWSRFSAARLRWSWTSSR